MKSCEFSHFRRTPFLTTAYELREGTSDAQRDGYEDEIITMVRVSLVDDEANVRSAAAKAFDILQEHIGAKAIDQTIPTLLEALRQPGQSSGTALQALREVMAVSIISFYLGCISETVLGPGVDGVPCPYPDIDSHPDDGFQCSRSSLISICRGYSSEQASDVPPERDRQSIGKF